jgi:hypothetical protein
VDWLRANVSKIRVLSGFLGFFFGVFLDLPLGGCFVANAGPHYHGPWSGCANAFGWILSGPRLAAPIISPVVAVMLTYITTRSILAIANRH